MGLDMYLQAIPVVDGYTFEELIKYHEVADSFLDNVPDDLFPYFRNTNMGQQLVEDIGQLRGANEVFDWIVYHTNYNELADDEHEYIFEREELETLLSLVNEILVTIMTKGFDDTQKGMLSNQGSFKDDKGRGTLINTLRNREHYQDSLLETKAILEKTLNDYDWNNYYIFFHGSY